MLQSIPDECPDCGGNHLTHVGPQAPSVYRVQCTRDGCHTVIDVHDVERCPPVESESSVDVDIEKVIDEHVSECLWEVTLPREELVMQAQVNASIVADDVLCHVSKDGVAFDVDEHVADVIVPVSEFVQCHGMDLERVWACDPGEESALLQEWSESLTFVDSVRVSGRDIRVCVDGDEVTLSVYASGPRVVAGAGGE